MKKKYTKPVVTCYELDLESPILAGSGQPNVGFTFDESEGTVDESSMFSNKFRPNYNSPWNEEY